MFYIYQRLNDISDYGADKRLRFDAILKIFQEAAVSHSASVGYPADTYMGKGSIWMLSRVMVHVHEFPDFTKKLAVKTWSGGMDKFRGFRNYEISSDEKTFIEGASIWIYIDIQKKRPVRITQDMIEKYDSENLQNRCCIIDKWDRKDAENYISEYIVPLRPADFDINGHMNNIRYAEIFSSVSQHIDFTAKTLGIYYGHEITPDIREVKVKYAQSQNSRIFSIFAGETPACLLEIF